MSKKVDSKFEEDESPQDAREHKGKFFLPGPFVLCVFRGNNLWTISQLETKSIYILREAFNQFEKPRHALVIGKDSTVLLWLARKAFLAMSPSHSSTSIRLQNSIDDRISDRLCKEWNLQLVVGKMRAR